MWCSCLKHCIALEFKLAMLRCKKGRKVIRTKVGGCWTFSTKKRHHKILWSLYKCRKVAIEVRLEVGIDNYRLAQGVVTGGGSRWSVAVTMGGSGWSSCEGEKKDSGERKVDVVSERDRLVHFIYSLISWKTCLNENVLSGVFSC